jgi:hypothetical protein
MTVSALRSFMTPELAPGRAPELAPVDAPVSEPVMAAAARARAPDRRRFRRVAVRLPGRAMTADGAEVDIRIGDASAGGVLLAARAPLAIESPVIIYARDLGRLTGRVVRARGHLAGIALDLSPYLREKLVERLTTLINQPHLTQPEERRSDRHAGGGAALLVREDGTAIDCEITDFSIVGLAVRCEGPRPMVGEWVQFGQVSGRVSRYLPGGFAVDFEFRREGP